MMQYEEVNLDYTYNDVLDWLRTLEPDSIVHDLTKDVCKECTIARFLQSKLGIPELEVAFVTADVPSDETGPIYRLHDWFGHCIHLLDTIASVHGETDDDRKLTAARVIEILENMERKA